MNRRQFLKLGAASAIAAKTSDHAAVQDFKPVRIGVVGVGFRGSYLVELLSMMPGVEIPAICDINPQNLSRSIAVVAKASGKTPRGYQSGPTDYLRLIGRDDLDAVITATPWDLHVPIMLATMKSGKYGATEVGPLLSLDDCWELVETSEATGMPCMTLENVCFFRNVMMVLNMVQRGLFGELVHCAGGYQHDLRAGKIDRATLQPSWPGAFHAEHNANLYPTHPIGPISQWLNITRGNRFLSLVSMSSKAAGLKSFEARRPIGDRARVVAGFKNGDVNVTLLQTHSGATVTLYYDTQLPRPYDLELRIQGTRGISRVTDDKVYLEDRSKAVDQWESLEAYHPVFEHPVWRRAEEEAESSGHGGSDYLTLEAFVEAARTRSQPPIDVYETVTWGVISALSEKSVGDRSASVEIPDFTEGKWQTREPAVMK